jgi:hypothetical protein
MTSHSVIKKYFFYLAISLLFFFSAYTLVRSVVSHIEFINYPYQHEYREGAVLTITDLYVNSENPFELQYQPQNTYVYGYFYPWIASFFAKAYGNTLTVHRWVSYAFILLTCLLIYFALNRLKINPVFSFTAAVILHQSLIYNGLTSIARPEGLGIFLLVLGILIPWRFQFSFASCLVSILLGILGYLTKPYYAFVLPVVFIYIFIFISKRKSISYLALSVFLICIFAASVILIYSTYHTNTLFVITGKKAYDYLHMKSQLLGYLRTNIFLFLIIIISLLVNLVSFLKNKQDNEPENYNHALRDNFLFNKSINIFQDKPVIKTNMDLLFCFTFLFGIFVFVIKLGGHLGNSGGAYLYHLVTPCLILTTFQIFNKNHTKVFKSVIAIILIVALARQFKFINFNFSKNIECYSRIENLISNHNNVLNSPEVVSILVEQNKPVYNSGHSQYFKEGVNNQTLIGASEDVIERENEFEKEIKNKIINKEFDLILLTKNNYSWFIDKDELNQYYEFGYILCATMPDKKWEIETWYPKK